MTGQTRTLDISLVLYGLSGRAHACVPSQLLNHLSCADVTSVSKRLPFLFGDSNIYQQR